LRERAKPPAKSSEIQQQRPGTAKQGEANKMQINLAPNPQTDHTSRGIKSKSGSRPRTSEAEPAAPTSIRRRAAARRGERSRAGPPVRAAASRGEALLPRRRLGRRAGALPLVQLGVGGGERRGREGKGGDLNAERSSVTALRPLTQPPSKWLTRVQATVPSWCRWVRTAIAPPPPV
jgi:hypothetical protein